MASVTIFSPAKINLFLAVTGWRDDGYHELVSVAAPLDFGDQLSAEAGGRRPAAGDRFSVECNDPEVPVGEANLVGRAARMFAGRTGWDEPVHFQLAKRIPMSAGLGGGSSNAVAALRALNDISGRRLAPDALADLAGRLGSDCALFLRDGPAIMRGRGERVEPPPAGAVRRLRGRRVLLFKPAFGIDTPWAYARLAVQAPGSYLPAAEAERRLAAWTEGDAPAEELLFNSFEPVVFGKYLALPALMNQLRAEFGLAPLLSGSGSAGFVLLSPTTPVDDVIARIREAWGPACFVQPAQIA
ncbi:MAG: 4-(cytidine 5'-diphospho)-2-C-methyl-D-erythritol kinase [Verrucomicrobia bacterium RIFCSPLOWO2_12_FULL_64_8]|nr:MAG: 4-(cytidine 5'-diphospho)-2-C-methyl-D-erythritol kinase [Verrucomicrobia bacterium RIFCSPLOWO2_12_FULL_64_8]